MISRKYQMKMPQGNPRASSNYSFSAKFIREPFCKKNSRILIVDARHTSKVEAGFGVISGEREREV